MSRTRPGRVPTSPRRKPDSVAARRPRLRRKIDYEWLRTLVTTTLEEAFILIVMAKPPRVEYQPTCPDCGGVLVCIQIQNQVIRRLVPLRETG